MRKNTTFAIVATIMGLAMIVWVKSSVVTTHAEVAAEGGVVALSRNAQLTPAHSGN